MPGPSQIPVYPEGQEWSDWLPFTRSGTIAAARYKLDRSGSWEVLFGGKPLKPTKKNPSGEGMTAISLYSYGPSDMLTEVLFWEWFDQYAGGGSAGIWFDLHVKRTGVPFKFVRKLT